MEQLYIKIDSKGKPVDHPLLESNLCEAFPNLNLNTTTEYVKFERVIPPLLTKYQYFEKTEELYIRDGDVFKDHYIVKEMDEEQKTLVNINKEYFVRQFKNHLLSTASENLRKSSESDKKDWEDYIKVIESHETDLDNPSFPAMPQTDENENIIRN
jgi:hypothetical protein